MCECTLARRETVNQRACTQTELTALPLELQRPMGMIEHAVIEQAHAESEEKQEKDRAWVQDESAGELCRFFFNTRFLGA